MRGAARKIIKGLHFLFDVVILSAIILLVSFAVFSAREAGGIYRESEADKLASYKPETEDALSFEELRKINGDVTAWLTVYGTPIDYPVVQGEDNARYINEDVFGSFSLTGALFLDYRNAPDFTDFNNVIFGHHMEKEMMFGDLDEFRDEEFFRAHDRGDLYADGRHQGLRFFAWMDADAYDPIVYKVLVDKEEDRQILLEHLRKNAAVFVDGIADVDDRLLLLSTCGTDVTNERYILAAVITDETYENAYAEEERAVERTLRGRVGNFFKKIRGWHICLLLLLLLAGIGVAVFLRKRKK